MRTLLSVLCLFAVAMTAGCDSMPTRLTERFAEAPPQEREIAKERAAVFRAIPETFKRMGFVTARALEAQGLLTGRSTIRSEDAFREARQYEFEIKVREFGEGVTKVSVRLSEAHEGDFKTGATSQAIRSHGLYESFFEVLDQVLSELAPAPQASATRD